jgi:hypothetical protein
MQRDRLKHASALIDLTIQDESYRALLFAASKESNIKSISSYDRSNYVKKDSHYNDGRSDAIIHNITDSYDLLRGIIEVNQRFTVYHAPKMGAIESRYWAYMTGYHMKDPKDLPAEIKVDFFLKQIIPIEGRTMIVRGVSLPLFGEGADIDLCFFSGLL